MTESIDDLCNAPLHPQAAEGLRLFNAGEYFEAHEALEDAWNAEPGKVRELYRGILQIAVVYLHITRGNYNGAVKVYGRSQRWMRATGGAGGRSPKYFSTRRLVSSISMSPAIERLALLGA